MAKVKFGSIVTDIRGSIGGTVYSRNSAGAYCKNLVIPSNPQTEAQQTVRSAFTKQAQGWSALTGNQRIAWNDFAALHPITDVFGNLITLSGYLMYCRLNNNIDYYTTLTLLTDPPADLNTLNNEIPTIQMKQGGGYFDFIDIPAALYTPEDKTILVWYGGIYRAGITNYNGPWKFMGREHLSGSEITVHYDESNFPIVVDGVYFIKYAFLTEYNGNISLGNTYVATAIA